MVDVRFPRRLGLSLALASGLLALLAGASDPAGAAVATRRLSTGLPPSRSSGSVPEAWVAPADAAPVLDGRLDENVWKTAPPLVLGELERRGETSPRTEVRLLWRDRTLYVGAELTEPHVAKLKRSAAAPDGPAWQDDSLEVFLSPRAGHDYFQFILGAGGAVFDRQGHGDPKAFNAGATAAVAVRQDGWSLEAAIPMAPMGVGTAVPTHWRGNFYRNRAAGGQGQSQAWSPTFRGDYDVPDRFGRLLFTPTSPWADQEATVRQQRGIDVEKLDGGQALLRLDRSCLPKGARIHRARLACQREPIDGNWPEVLKPVEIYALAGPWQKDKVPQHDPRPLELVPPWYQSFDITDLVRAWSDGSRPCHGLYVKAFPAWRPEKTYLELMYDGPPENVPAQATGVQALHRAGQTFITWKEIDDPVGQDEIAWGALRAILNDLDRRREVRYCVYRSRQPITAQNLGQAEPLAAVAPLSCWNVHGRNKARAIDRFIATADVLHWHQWNPFGNADVDGPYGTDCPIDRLVIAAGQPPLPRGTGLYVHTAREDQPAYYAVVTRIDGIENTRDIGPGNSLASPVRESVADPEPVLQGELPKMPFFNFKDRRLHYVHWVGPDHTNKPYDYYNWSVGLPEGLKDRRGAADPDGAVALELNLHRDGYDYWRTHYRIEPGSIVLAPHDFPLKTWWYGYHEAHGTLRPWSQGVVRNYTEKRLLWFVDWAAKQWPVDRNRILVTGCHGGASGSGALSLGLRYPEVFNLVVAGHGLPRYNAVGQEVERIWGQLAWDLKTESGRSVWEELDLMRHVRDLSPRTELPLVSMTYADTRKECVPLVQALMAGGHAVLTHTAWGGRRMLPVSARATNFAVPLDIRKTQSLLAVAAIAHKGDAVHNGSLLWKAEDLVDEPDRYAVTLVATGSGFEGQVTPRRLQRFHVQPGKTYAWRIDPLETPRSGRTKPLQSLEGQTKTDERGLWTLEKLKLAPGVYRLTVSP